MMQQAVITSNAAQKKNVRLSVDLSPRLKRAFKTRCVKRGVGMSDQVASLIYNWLKYLDAEPKKH